MVLRVLAAWDGTSYAVLPGGLTRVATGQQSLVVSMQAGGGSKDTWVIGAADDTLVPSSNRRRRLASRSSTELSSRMADNLFWLGRYAERLEANARLFRVLLPGPHRRAAQGRHASVDTILHFLRGLDLLPPETRHATVARQWWNLQRIVTDMVFDTQARVEHRRQPAPGAASQLGSEGAAVARHVARAAAALHDAAGDAAGQPRSPLSSPRSRALDDVVIMLAAFAGLQAENPTRGFGWRFLSLGRRMERALQMLELLRVGVAIAPFPDDAYLEVLLQVADSSTTYRSRYLASIRTRYVLELLLADETNPRSVAFQAAALLDGVHSLPRHQVEAAPPPEYTMAKRLRQLLRDANMDEIKRRDANGPAPGARSAPADRAQRRHRPLRRDHGALLEPFDAVAAAVRLRRDVLKATE